MRLPADLRHGLERACRAGAIVAIVLLAWRVGRPREGEGLRVGNTSGLGGALARATESPVAALDLRLDSLPGPAERAWLSAIASSGTPVQWQATGSLPSLAVAAEPLVDPQGGVRVTAFAPVGASLRMADSIGVLDSTVIGALGVRVVESITAGGLRAEQREGTASAASVDSLELLPVLVLARAGWEGRFTAAALQEAGWRVEVDFGVTDPSVPNAGGGANVRTSEAALPIDTARYSAVIALDEHAASRAASIVRFVRDGGGVVLGPAAATLPALAVVLPARPGASVAGEVGGLGRLNPRTGLSARALVGLRDDAVAVDRRGPIVLVAARRVGPGRALVIGYSETWRWRMEGGPTSPEDHRAWWSAIVGSVSRIRVSEDTKSNLISAADPAPYASLVGALGQPVAQTRSLEDPRQELALEVLLALLALALLLAEWASRRTRGAT
ncbi:MAG: hypothetical protein IT361_14050 [Gemmatimonadaceae bacterium]|nr:hypothetical protein [Gemmatimonadaceae bacterium]